MPNRSVPAEAILHCKFVDFLDTQIEAKTAIVDIAQTYRDKFVDLGLHHFSYRALYVDENDVTIPICNLIFATPDWIDFFYSGNEESKTNAMGMSHPSYQVAFFSKGMGGWSAEYNEIVIKAIESGMATDFFFIFRDNPITGGGLAGGAFNEKLPKSALCQALGLGAEMHSRVSDHVGHAYEKASGLTDTEMKYLEHLYFGLSAKEIARTSNVTENWVAKTLMNLRRKLGVTSNTAAVAKASAVRVLR